MFLRLPILIAAALALSITVAEATSITRNFFNPDVFGKPVALCMSGRASCGKPTADAWCHNKGFAEALTFERMRTTDNSLVFRQIKCISRRSAVAAAAGQPKTATP